MRKYVVGFVEGVKQTCAECKVIVKYIGSFGDAALGKAIAIESIEQGADVVFGMGFLLTLVTFACRACVPMLYMLYICYIFM